VYLPTLLSKDAIDIAAVSDDTDSVPHPRKRINEVFEDGDKCVLLLKDRGKLFRNPIEEEWYEKAYGKKRNMMTYTLTLDVPEGKIPPSQKYSFFAQLTYNMFPEHEKEFKHMNFENQFVVQLVQDEYAPLYHEAVIDLPFGTVSSKLLFRDENDEEKKLKSEGLIPAVEQAFKADLEPIPISMETQAQRDKLEEEDNKKREQEARAAQERLEAEKARLRQEQMLQIQKQEANANKLLVYTKAMTLSFHEKPEDFNQSMSFLSIYHEELEANFQYYSQLFNKSVYHHPVNSQIVLQGFFHFLKIAKLAGSCSDVMQLMQGISQIEGLMLPVEDTLNLKNGLNYAQFLEAILRIAFLKAAETGKSYASTLEDIFSN